MRPRIAVVCVAGSHRKGWVMENEPVRQYSCEEEETAEQKHQRTLGRQMRFRKKSRHERQKLRPPKGSIRQRRTKRMS